MRKQLKAENRFTVCGWMVTELGLSGNALMIYAIIYEHSQTENTDYSGGYKYLAECVGADITTVQRVVKSLVEAGILTRTDKEENNRIIPHFRAVRGMR